MMGIPLYPRTGVGTMAAMGGSYYQAATLIDFVSVSPTEAVIKRRTRYVPACAYACETIIPAATGVLSPKSHANVARDPSGSREADPSKEIASPANGAVGKIAKAATGGAFTWTFCVVELARPALSR